MTDSASSLHASHGGDNEGSNSGTHKRQGRLTLFVGAAPGVGKTYTMLRQANNLLSRGIDVVVGHVDVHERSETERQLEGLEVIPSRKIVYQGHQFEEMDVEAIIARRPAVAIIDELAHSNVPGTRRAKRYMDVEDILDEGIDVLTAVNVQHLEDAVKHAEEITGVKIREVIPNSFVSRASEIEVIDVTPETLRQRLRDGVIYSPDKVQQALDNFFRMSNLSSLRELALRVVADNVDERLQKSVDRNQIRGPIGAKETVLACVNYVSRAETIIKRASRMALRMKADFYTLTLIDSSRQDLSEKAREHLEKLRAISEQYGAVHFVEERNERKAGAVILEIAEGLNVTQIVVGQPSTTSRLTLWRASPVRYLLRNMRYLDVRIVGWKEQHQHDEFKDESPVPEGKGS